MAEQSQDEAAIWHRRFGVECNNAAWRLAEAASRTPAEDEEMLHSAHAAALHWGRIGTPLHAARAEMLLGHVHALLGNGQLAVRYARAAYDYVMAHDSAPWEIAFAHAVLANAAHAAGDARTHATEYATAAEQGSALGNDEERAIFTATFCRITMPAGDAQ